MSFIRKAASAMTLSKPQTFAETLARVSLFSGLPQAVLEDLALQLQPQDGVAGQVLAQAGSVGDAVWLIAHGTVEGINAESGGGPTTVVLEADQVVAESLLLMGGRIPLRIDS
jgi:CRP-like cAMP-binding protein